MLAGTRDTSTSFAQLALPQGHGESFVLIQSQRLGPPFPESHCISRAWLPCPALWSHSEMSPQLRLLGSRGWDLGPTSSIQSWSPACWWGKDSKGQSGWLKPGPCPLSYLFCAPVPWVTPISQGSRILSNEANQRALASALAQK